MSPLSAVRQTTGLVVGAADFVVHHPARTAVRVVDAARAAAQVLAGGTATVVPPREPMSPPIPAPGPDPVTPGPISPPEPVPGPGPVQPPEPEPAPMPGGLADSLADDEILTSAGTIGVAPGINPDTGLPNHAPGE